MDIPLFAKILDPQVSARSAKYALIDTKKLHGDGKLRITLGDKLIPCSTPFGVSTYNNDDATRKNIKFTVSPSDEARINSIYNWSMEYLAAKPEKFFKKPVSKDELQELFKHPIVKKQKYPPRLKCKIDMAGKKCSAVLGCKKRKVRLAI